MRQNRRPQCRRYKVCRSHQTGNASCRMLSANPLDRGALLRLHRLHHLSWSAVRSPQSSAAPSNWGSHGGDAENGPVSWGHSRSPGTRWVCDSAFLARSNLSWQTHPHDARACQSQHHPESRGSAPRSPRKSAGHRADWQHYGGPWRAEYCHHPTPRQPPVETPSSFASALDTSTGSLADEEKGAAALLKVSEAIQQKMRRLKQL